MNKYHLIKNLTRETLCFLILLFIGVTKVSGQQNDGSFETPFELSNGIRTATYEEAILFYKHLAKKFKTVAIESIGKSDGGYDLSVVYFHAQGVHLKNDTFQWDRNKQIALLINNDIHAGEPDGVDACMMLVRDAVVGKIKIPENVVLAIIPVYNVGGALNRNNTSRANQNGPETYGFRGNACNLDLNRDFIKTDAKETECFHKLFTFLDPEIFIDNHVSDGADYQHVMTLLSTQHDKLGGATGELMQHVFTPLLFEDMKSRGYDMVPYVNDFDNTPDRGWKEFYDLPRFSSGYASLFQTLAYVPETHMLKPFKQRVEATYSLMQSFIFTASKRVNEIKEARSKDRFKMSYKFNFSLDWTVDTTKCDSILFSGYAATQITSGVSGLPRLFYDRKKPYTKKVPFYNHYVPAKTITAPIAYIIPRAWEKIIAMLGQNGVETTQLERDSTIEVTAYHIDNYETAPRPYESHYLHRNLKVTAQKISKKFRPGDYLVNLNQNQRAKRYLIETLEPTAPDAFLAWNFFDGILQQKEYFSDYVFEDTAAKLISENASLRKLLEDKKTKDSVFSMDASAQLDFIYRNSFYMEKGYLQYPVCRID